MASLLHNIASKLSSPVEKRLFAEYGAIFVTTATPPPEIVFSDAEEVERFQSSLTVACAVFGEHCIELQSEALGALVSAACEIKENGGSFSSRGIDAGRRSYQDTEKLWTRNVSRGLEHWRSRERITAERAQAILQLPLAKQVEEILELEQTDHLFFGTFFDKSILYSVAAPGASQHLSLLAFDVAEYEDPLVEEALVRHGWYRTVPADLPHFTYLGHDLESLPGLGLVRIQRSSGDRTYDFWVPDLARLQAD
ncbi:MAG TPA: hypothetical protein VKF81_04305 [Blastocatellia bacterium]|nr:hypothetical protein [Blastocatellia bacterium]